MVEPVSAPVIDKDHFSTERYCASVQIMADNPEEIDIQAWSDFVYETVNLFRGMGKAMGMAFSGIL